MAYTWLLSIDENIWTWYSLKALIKNNYRPQWNRKDTRSLLFTMKGPTLVETVSKEGSKYKTIKVIQEHLKPAQVLILRGKAD